MKGTLDIEFMVSIFVFLTALSFVLMSLIGNLPKLHQQTLSEDIDSKSFQISEVILFSQGSPENWQSDPADAAGIGLSNGTRYFLSTAKIDALQAFCAGNYNKIKGMLGLDFKNDVMIELNLSETGTYKACRPPALSTTRPKAMVTRLAVDEATKKIWTIRVSVL